MSTSRKDKNTGIIDITKTGPLSYRQLQSMNNNLPEPIEGEQDFNVQNPYVGIGRLREFNYGDFGSSKYDEGLVNSHQLEHYEDYRSTRQSTGAKWLHGLTKGIGLAATTFIDGTLGLVYGLCQAALNGDVSKIWSNDISDGLAQFNDDMEKWLPNYRTQEQLDNAWFENIGTADFWADGVLKNLGFAVGAYYSGAAYTKGLQAIGWVKRATSAQVIGSLLSGFNEARIEANHNQRDFLKLQESMVNDARERKALEIAGRTDIDDAQKIELFKELDANYTALRQDALEKAHSMGLTTLIGNTVLLTIDNMWQFGKLYSRGFRNARGIANAIENGAAREGIEEAIESGVKHYIPKTTSKARKLARGFSNGLVEGNEEMAQAFIADYAGNRQSYDSPDAYYEALTDPEARLKTKDLMTSVAEGFANTYGNGDRWEEFAIGAFTGLLGMPTFGKVANSDANTWLGRGKSVGISGGLLGEYRSAMQTEKEAKEAADVMNKYVDKIHAQANYFAQSQSFTDAMDGFAAESNNFEYKNASNNDDFAAISRFARTGRLNDLKEMVRQDFENMSDEQLVDIAMNTTPNVSVDEDGMVSTTDGNNQTMVGGWRNADGSLMSDTEEGRQQMREELAKKRDKILNEIDQYEKSVETVRAIGNNSLTEDQVNELAWLNWKTKIFEDRYGSLKSEIQEDGTLDDLRWVINDYIENLENADPESLAENAGEVKRHMSLLRDYIDALKSSRTSKQLGQIVDANPAFQQALNSDLIEAVSGISHDNFVNIMSKLQDLAKIGNAANQFDKRYKEFSENPINLIKNRERIDKKREKINKAVNDTQQRDEVNRKNVSELVKDAENGSLNLDDMDSIFGGDFEQEFGEAQASQGKAKVQEAKDIINSSRKAQTIITSSDADQQVKADALTLLNRSKEVAESEDELTDLSSAAFNDPSILYDDTTIGEITGSDAELQAMLNQRLDNAKSLLAEAFSTISDDNNSLEDLGEVVKEGTTVGTLDQSGMKTTGHDPVDAGKTVNEEQNERERKEQERRAKASNPLYIDNVVSGMLDELAGQVSLDEFDKQALQSGLYNAVRDINHLNKEGLSPEQIMQTISSTLGYQTAMKVNPNTDAALRDYISRIRQSKAEEAEIEAKQAAEQAEMEAPTPTITEEELNTLEIAQAETDNNALELPDSYMYWKPTITQLPIKWTKGVFAPFYKLARQMVRGGSPMFTDAQLKRIEAVGQYLDETGTFNSVNLGTVQPGDKIGFKINKALNEAAGEPVILMIDENGDILGDIMSRNDPTFRNQAFLEPFVERVLKEYEDAGSPDAFISKETTVVDKNMIGKVPYGTVLHTLNEVHTNPNGGKTSFKLGISMSDGQSQILATAGRVKAMGQSKLEQSIIPALNAKKGQPFLLMPTSDKTGRRQYIPVPFIMERYNANTAQTSIGSAVRNVLGKIQSSDNGNVINVIAELKELLAAEEIHINYSGDNVKVHVKTRETPRQVQIYNGSKNSETLVQQLEQGLQSLGIPFQVSRKYINERYNGMEYNEMIGEIAKINLNVGDTHTVSDWFTVRPIDANGKVVKAKSPKTTGVNPNAVTSTQIPWWPGGAVNVDLKTKKVTKLDGTEVKDNAALAYVFGRLNGKDINSEPYDTEWGRFNPKTMKFEFSTHLGKVVEASPISSLFSSDQVADIIVDPTYPNYAGTSRKDESLGVITLQKGSFTPEEVLAHMKGESENKYTKQKKEVLDRLITGHTWTLERIEDLLDTPEAATTYVIAHERSHQEHLKINKEDEIYDTTTEDGENGWMSEKALAIETRATLDGLRAVQELKYPKTASIKFAETYSGYFEGGGASIEDDYKIPVDDKAALKVISTFEDAILGSTELTDTLAKDFLNVLKKYNPERYEKDKAQFLGESPISTPSRPQVDNPTELATKQGLLGDNLSREVWSKLPTEVQARIVSKRGPKQIQWMDKLKLNYDVKKGEFKKSIEEILGEKYREMEGTRVSYDLNKELGWLSKVLPQYTSDERLQLVKGLTKIGGNTQVYGMFRDSVIYLNTDNQTRGTTYHEAFHAVFNTLMNDSERKMALREARAMWGNLDEIALEEKLAENFRQYTEYEEYNQASGLRGNLTRLWRKLNRMIRHLLGKDTTLNKLYYDINHGKMANRQVSMRNMPRTSSRFREIADAEAELDYINNEIVIAKEWDRAMKYKTRSKYQTKNVDGVKYQLLDFGGDFANSEYQARQRLHELAPHIGKVIITHVNEDKYKMGVPFERPTSDLQELNAWKEELENEIKELKYQERLNEYYSDFDRLDPEMQMNLFDFGITKEDWENVDGYIKDKMKQCFG